MTADFVYISVKSKVSYQVAGIACDKKLLIGGNDPDLDLAVGSGDLLQLASQTWLTESSSLMPRYSMLWHTSARTSSEFSPMPPVKITASSPFMTAA